MSTATVHDLCGAWHEAVELDSSAARARLPEPWREAGTIAGLTIVPLATAAEIVAEGRAMHHCARTRIDTVARGLSYLFSVRRGERRIATVEVKRVMDGGVAIDQMRGPCNAVLDKPTQAMLRRWTGQRGKWKLPAAEVYRRQSLADDLDDLPF
jgi:hypothetical protein